MLSTTASRITTDVNWQYGDLTRPERTDQDACCGVTNAGRLAGHCHPGIIS
jgi:hypothetical protein